MELPNYPWIKEAAKLIGANENTPAGAAVVDALWKDWKMSGYVGKATKVPWCSALVGGSFVRAGLPATANSPFVKENSQYWLGYGRELAKPAVGCIVVFKWGWGGGHVGFVVGETATGSLLVLGGNQDDAVNIKAFKRSSSIQGYRWPEGFGEPDYNLPKGTAEMIVTTR